MKFYVIPPVAHMNLAMMGDRIYCLAHLWVKYPAYRQFILDRKEAGWFITLDNSAAERALVTEDVLLNIVRELMPNEVIAPDILFDGEETERATRSFIHRMVAEKLTLDVQIFGCPQGNTKDEWMQSYLWMLSDPRIDVIGLSKISVPKAFLNQDGDQGIMEGRLEAVKELYTKGYLKKPIHCLGMGNPNEYMFYKGIPQIRSTDSCYSVLAAQHGIRFGGRIFKRIPTPDKYFSSVLSPYELSLAEKNILWMKDQLH